MIPYSYSMVNMGGIDLAEANGTVVEGLYESITEAVNACGDVVFYNWKFAGIEITPTHVSSIVFDNAILINGLIQVSQLDVVTVIGLPPPIAPVSPLEVTENGTYEAEPPASGFNPVVVDVPEPVLIEKEITENGEYIAVDDSADGYSEVTVNVNSNIPVPIICSSVKTNGVEAGPFASNSEYFRPCDSNYNYLIPDWRNPFEIKVTFKVTATSGDYQSILCSTSGYWQNPDIQIGQNLSSIWTEFTSTGSAGTWIGFTVADDDITLPLDTECWVKIIWDGTTYSFTYFDGTDEHTKSITPGATPYYSSAATMKMGSGPFDRPFHGKIKLTQSYIKQNNIIIWGNAN